LEFIHRERPFGGPVGEVADVISQAPAGRHRQLPGRLGDTVEDLVELGLDGVGGLPVRLERCRPRVGDERIAVVLAGPQAVDPWLDDREMVEDVAVQDVEDPAPGSVAADDVER